MRNKCCLASVVLAVVCVVAVYAAFNTAGYSLSTAPAVAEKNTSVEDSSAAAVAPGAAVVQVVSVHDGDTFNCDIEDYPEIVGHHIGVRINGIDTPEMNDKRPAVRRLAIKARDYSERRLNEARTVELRGMERDKYFRILAEVYVDGASLGGELVDAGLARPYDGGRKPKW